VNPPEEQVNRTWHNQYQPTPDTYPDPAQTTVAGLDAAFGHNPNPTPPPVQTETRPLNVLAIAAGGKYATYSAGVLSGWTATGTRPKFDVVTGVSGGALLAVLAFLGSEYDKQAEELFINITRRDLFRISPVRSLITRGSIASTEPMAEQIERVVNDCVVAEIAQAHREGRRLFIPTGNRTSLRVAIWDVGAVAASGRPDAAVLVRKILLAAASHPGFAPPVEFDITLNGVHYRELHGDGGNLIQTFVQTANGLPKGSNVYLISAGKLYRDMQDERPRPVSAVVTAASNALYALYRADVSNIYALCAVSQARFHMLATPPEVKVTAGSLSFNREDQQQLFDAGYRQIAIGPGWLTAPPWSQPGQPLTPRTGLDYVTDTIAPAAVK
jgi:predicted acylesterase/phospholipase RssA